MIANRMDRLSSGLFVILVTCGLSAPVACQVQPGSLQTDLAGERARLSVLRHYGFPVVNATELTTLWGATARSGVFFRAHLTGAEIVFELGSPFFQHGELTHQMTNAPYERDGEFWLPAELVTRWLSSDGAAVELAESVAGLLDEPLPARVDPKVAWRVIIDPGHGGRDPGTSGQKSREKDVVLAIGRLLYEDLQRRDLVEPSMTRNSDIYVKHDVRSQFAVDKGGDLFVSIHTNAAYDRRARGFETIFLGPARSEEAREVALRENRGPSVEDAAGSLDDMRFILAGLDRTENLTESQRFAGFVQNAIRKERAGRSADRGVKQGPWWVLLGALVRMPSVIVEAGFLSNETEEDYLISAQGQRAIARAIADAIVDYRRDVLNRYTAPEGGEQN